MRVDVLIDPFFITSLFIFCRGNSRIARYYNYTGGHRDPPLRLFMKNYQCYIPYRNRTKSLLRGYAELNPADLHSPVPYL